MERILKCKKCGKKIVGGFYNTPSGAYCCECWEKVPQRKKDKALKETMRELGIIASMLR